jgi:hypothetical protein
MRCEMVMSMSLLPSKIIDQTCTPSRLPLLFLQGYEGILEAMS